MTSLDKIENILIVSSDQLGYAKLIFSTFESLGVSSYCLSINVSGLLNRALLKFDNVLHKKKRDFDQIQNLILSNNIKYLFLLYGDEVLDSNEIALIKEKYKVVIITWFIDSIEKLPNINKYIHLIDHIFTYDNGDVMTIKSLKGVKDVTYMPLFCDSSKYYSNNEIYRDIDIVFVGAWHGGLYKKRREALTKISKIARTNNLIFKVYGGGGWRNFPRYIRDLVSANGFRSNVHMGNLSHKQINDLYNRSHISINIAADNQETGVPIRVFEVPATGCMLITSKNVGLKKIRDLCYEAYDDISELDNLIMKLMDDEIVSESYKKCIARLIKKHSLKSRLVSIVSKIS